MINPSFTDGPARGVEQSGPVQEQAEADPQRLDPVDHPALEAHRGGVSEVAAARGDLLDVEAEVGGLHQELGVEDEVQ